MRTVPDNIQPCILNGNKVFPESKFYEENLFGHPHVVSYREMHFQFRFMIMEKDIAPKNGPRN